MTHTLWPTSGYDLLSTNAQGHLQVTDDFLRFLLERPELAPIATSCSAELTLHHSLMDNPKREVTSDELAQLQDTDAAENYAVWLRFRQRIVAKPTLEASYLALFQGDGVDVPPLLVQQITHILLRHVLGETPTALQARAAEMLMRPQKITVLEDGAVMAADDDTVERHATQSSFGSLGELLTQGGIKLRSVDLDVLNADNQEAYWPRSESFDWVLSLNRGQPGLDALCEVLGETPTALQARAAEMLMRPQKITVLEDGAVMAADDDTVERHATQSSFGSLGELLTQGGIKLRSVDLDVLNADNQEAYWPRSESFDWVLSLNRGQPGLDALCEVMARWVQHFLGVEVRIQTEREIDDDQWVWHVGLDAQASGVLNDLYQGLDVAPERMERLLCLFKLEFVDPSAMRAEVRGKPVYLAMAVDGELRLKLKPQNLLLNLPLSVQ